MQHYTTIIGYTALTLAIAVTAAKNALSLSYERSDYFMKSRRFSRALGVLERNMTFSDKIEEEFYLRAGVKHRLDIPITLIQEYYDTLGPKGMLSVLEHSNHFCHHEAHNLGRVIYARTENLIESTKICGSTCADGCFHGVAMQLITNAAGISDSMINSSSKHSNVAEEKLRPYYQQICINSSTVKENKHTADCYHAVGHAILSSVARDDISICMAECKTLVAHTDQYCCASGGYMEWIHNHRPELGNGLFPCNMTSDFPAACYRFQMMSVSKWHTIAQSTQLCNNLTEVMQRIGCMHGLGYAYSMAYFTRTAKLFPVHILCSSRVDTLARAICINGFWWGQPYHTNTTLRKDICKPLMGSNTAVVHACLHGGSAALYENTSLFYSTSETSPSSLAML